MQETMTQISNQLTERWAKISKRNKIAIVAGLTICLVAIGIGSYYFTRPVMQKLYYQNLSTNDIADIVTVLDEAKIPYEVIEQGTNIEIKESDYNNAKIALAKENIPRGDYTFTDALNNTMSTTESEKQAKMHQLKEVELAQMLMTIEDVEEATVDLVIPEDKNSFIESKLESSASIVLTLHNPLTSDKVEGISKLISSSVENLKSENITILDSEGNALYIGDSEIGFTTGKQQELKTAAEVDIKTKVIQLLEPIYDEIRVSPNLILDFTQHEEMTEAYSGQEDTGKGLVATEHTKAESSVGGVGGAQPGTATNGGDIPTYPVGGAGNTESESSEKNVTYNNNKTISNTIKNQGDIDYKNSSISVHVFKEKIYEQSVVEKTLEDGQTWESFKLAQADTNPLVVDEGMIQSIKNGTGIENVVVYGYEKPIFVEKEAYKLQARDYLLFAILLIVLIAIAIIFTKFRKQTEEVETEPELEIEEMLHVAREESEKEEVESAAEIEYRESLETKRQIEKFVDEKPEAVASLLRSWLTEDEWE